MPPETDRGKLLQGAAIAGAAGIGLGALAARRGTPPSDAEKSRAGDLEKRRARSKVTRAPAKVPPATKPMDPKKAAHLRQTPEAARQQRKYAQSARLAKRADKAAKRGLGAKVPKMGAMGLAAGGLGAAMDAREIDKEGGRFIARFGKFVERTLGIPAGTTGRPQTEQERLASTLY